MNYVILCSHVCMVPITKINRNMRSLIIICLCLRMSMSRADPADRAVHDSQVLGDQADPDRHRRPNQFPQRRRRQFRPTRRHKLRAGEQLTRVANNPSKKATTTGKLPTSRETTAISKLPEIRADIRKYCADASFPSIDRTTRKTEAVCI